MFDIGPGELILLLAIALLIFGPSRLPELARSLGKGIREFREAIRGETTAAGRSEDSQPQRGND
jgi:sec-independent protein translocase protein TatA